MAAIAALEHRLKDWLDERRDGMLSLLQDLVTIDSGTANIAGV